MVLETIWTSFMSQIHEGTLGVGIKATDIDTGSHSGILVCKGAELSGSISREHPEITFNEPMQNVHVHATGGGKTIWDADYNLGGKNVLAKTAVAGSGESPNWHKVCTPQNQVEQYRIDITGTSLKGLPVNTFVSFTSDNGVDVAMPAKTLPVRVPLPGGDPLLPPVVHINSQDLDPLRYLKQRLF